jgi:hypothetical protein
MSFRLYVDGTEALLANVSCSSAPTPAGYECSGTLPSFSSGSHVLQLTSVLYGLESERSAPLTVTSDGTNQLATVPPALVMAAPSLEGRTICDGGQNAVCYSARIVAGHLRDAMALTPTPDGRVFFVEGGTAVRTIVAGRVLAEPALELAAPGQQIVGLAVDPHFDTTHDVFVAWTERAARGASTLNITRYRELRHVLGEGATIASGMPCAAGALAPLAVDHHGLLYAALPSTQGAASGIVARFTRDGLVPDANPQTSPTLAEGFAMPTAIAVDPARGTIWLAGTRPDGRGALATFRASEANSAWPIRPVAVDRPELNIDLDTRRPQLARRTTVAFARLPGAGPLFTLAGRLFSGARGGNGEIHRLEEIRVGFDIDILSAARGQDGAIYAVIADDASTTILQLLPATPTGVRKNPRLREFDYNERSRSLRN